MTPIVGCFCRDDYKSPLENIPAGERNRRGPRAVGGAAPELLATSLAPQRHADEHGEPAAERQGQGVAVSFKSDFIILTNFS